MTTLETLNLARQRQQEGQLAEAESLFGQVIAADSRNAEAHFRLGSLLLDMGRLDASIAAFRQAASLRPDVPQAQFNLGVALDQKKEFAQAISCYRRVLSLRPDDQRALNNLGADLCRVGQWDQAVASLQLAVRIAPAEPQCQLNLGNALLGTGDHDRAIESFNRALALHPDSPDALNNLGNAYKASGHADQAVECYQKVLNLQPDSPAVQNNLLFALYFDPAQDSQSILRRHQEFGAKRAADLNQPIAPPTHDPAPDRPLRIGYVSADFRNHPAGRHVFPLLRDHDHQQFQAYCYSNVQTPDGFTEKLHAHAAAWREIRNLSDDQAADLIRQDTIDILVDLSLYGPGNRLTIFAHKPAPIQATFIGYPGTTGLPAIDWRLTDPYLDPPGQNDADYSERSFRLPETFWCYDLEAMQWEPAGPAAEANPPRPAPLPALAAGHVTFGCLNNFSKINDALLQLWARVLQASPQSHLLMLAPPGGPRSRVLQVLAAGGVQPERVDFVRPQPRRLYLEQYARIDIALDTLPYNGHTTSLDGLWMGVPLVTRPGPAAVGRAGVSLLNNLQLPELIASDDEHYVKIAADLAADLPRLTELRGALRSKMLASPLTDGPRFTRNVQAAYREMWTRRS